MYALIEAPTFGEMCFFYSCLILVALFLSGWRLYGFILLISIVIAVVSGLCQRFSYWKEYGFRYMVDLYPVGFFKFTYTLFCLYISVSKALYHGRGNPYLAYPSFCLILLSVNICYGIVSLTRTENGEKGMLVLIYDFLLSIVFGLLADRIWGCKLEEIFIFGNTLLRVLFLILFVFFILLLRECLVNLIYRKKKKGRLFLVKKMLFLPIYYIEEQAEHFQKIYKLNHPGKFFKTLPCREKSKLIAEEMLREIRMAPKGRIYLTETHQVLADYVVNKNKGAGYTMMPGITGKSDSAFASVYGYNWRNNCPKCSRDQDGCPYAEKKRKTFVLVFRKKW